MQLMNMRTHTIIELTKDINLLKPNGLFPIGSFLRTTTGKVNTRLIAIHE